MSDQLFKDLIYQVIERLSNTYADSKSVPDSLRAIGLAIWDIFSNNNSVINHNGDELDLGSWNTAAENIANSVNEINNTDFDGADFYEGTEVASGISPVDQLDNYTDIFLLLHEMGYDWRCGSEIDFNVCVMDGYTVQAYKSIYKK